VTPFKTGTPPKDISMSRHSSMPGDVVAGVFSASVATGFTTTAPLRAPGPTLIGPTQGH